MKSQTKESPPGFRNGIGAIGFLVLMLFAWTPLAFGAAAGGAQIFNVATLSYDDAGGTTITARAATTVTVADIEAAVTLSGAPTGGSGGTSNAVPGAATTSSGGTITYLYGVTANANVTDVYTFTGPNNGLVAQALLGGTGSVAMTLLDPLDQSTPIGGALITTSTITLGATVVTGIDAADIVRVPAGTTTDLDIGDTVVINAVDYEIIAVSAGTQGSLDIAGGPNSTPGTLFAEAFGTIRVQANALGANTAPSFGAGDIGQTVREQVILRVQVTGTVAGAADGTVDHDITIDPNASPASIAVIQSTIQYIDITIQKEVRNITQSQAFAATLTGAVQNDILEYRVTVLVNAGTAAAVSITDAVPQYTTLLAWTAGGGYGGGPVAAAATSVFAEATDGSAGATDITMDSTDTEAGTLARGNTAGNSDAAGTAITFYLGTAATNAAGGAMDTTAPDNTFVILYQVQVN